MLVGRQVNAGEKMSVLKSIFGHDYRTMKKWADAMRSDDPEFIAQAFRNRGGKLKLTNAVVKYVKGRYREIKAHVHNYRQKIAAEINHLFDVTLSRESLRGIFREADDQDKNEVNVAFSDVVGMSEDGATKLEPTPVKKTRISHLLVL